MKKQRKIDEKNMQTYTNGYKYLNISTKDTDTEFGVGIEKKDT